MGQGSSKESNQKANKSYGDQYSTPVPVERSDYTKPLERHQLPTDLQQLVDREENLWDSIYDGKAPESTDSSVRYAAYATRIRTILLSAHRYVAYTSDIGESFRPVAHPWLIRSAYGVSWLYLIGDVSHEGYKAYLRQADLQSGRPSRGYAPVHATDASSEIEFVGQRVPAIDDWRSVMAERAVFQSIASMGLPAFTIHSIVRYSGRAMKHVKNPKIRTWGPIGLGLAAVPALPYMFDKPVEEAVSWTFRKVYEAVGGPAAVRPLEDEAAPQATSQASKSKPAGKIKEL